MPCLLSRTGFLHDTYQTLIWEYLIQLLKFNFWKWRLWIWKKSWFWMLVVLFTNWIIIGNFLKSYNIHCPQRPNAHGDGNKPYFMEYIGGFTEEKYLGDTFSKGPPRENTINMMNIWSYPGSKYRDGFPHRSLSETGEMLQNTRPSKQF